MTTDRVARALRKGFSSLVLGRPLFPIFFHPTLEWILYSHASPEGGLNREKHYLFKLMLENLPSENPLLEIGVFAGRSTNALVFLKQIVGADNLLITTDPWLVCPEDPITSSISGTAYRSFIRKQFEENVRFWSSGELPISFPLSSDDFFTSWAEAAVQKTVWGTDFKMGGAFSAVLLDGDHSSPQIERDFHNIDQFLERNGLVYLDDSDVLHRNTGERKNEVYALAKKILGTGRYEVFAQNPNFVLRKR